MKMSDYTEPIIFACEFSINRGKLRLCLKLQSYVFVKQSSPFHLCVDSGTVLQIPLCLVPMVMSIVCKPSIQVGFLLCFVNMFTQITPNELLRAN